jgi:hypothetical protein
LPWSRLHRDFGCGLAQTPAKRFKFESHPLLHFLFNGFVIRLFRSTNFSETDGCTAAST